MMEKFDAVKGLYRDVLENADGRVLYDSGWVPNTIVAGCHILLAGLIKNDPSVRGIQYLAVGRGEEDWDQPRTHEIEDQPGTHETESTATDLIAQYEPTISVTDQDNQDKCKIDLTYLDENDKATDKPTNCLQLTAYLKPGYPAPDAAPLSTYPLREFGLFGEIKGTSCMINNVRHSVIHKDKSSTLVRTIRLYF